MTRLDGSGMARRRFLARMGGAGVAAVAGPTLLSACTPVGTGDTFDRVRKQGFISVGFANEAPYGYTDLATGELTGESPELARVILEELGVEELRGVPVSFDGLIPGLKGGQYDMAAAGMAILPERCAEVSFTNPEYLSRTAFLVPEGNPNGITDFGAFTENPDLTLGVMNATIEQQTAGAVGIPESQVQTAPDPPSLYELLETGRIDAVALTAISLRWILQTRGGPYEVTDGFFPTIEGEKAISGGGFAVRQEDDRLREAFNRQLERLKRSDRLLDIIKPFGFTEQELPGDLTASQLCEG